MHWKADSKICEFFKFSSVLAGISVVVAIVVVNSTAPVLTFNLIPDGRSSEVKLIESSFT